MNKKLPKTERIETAMPHEFASLGRIEREAKTAAKTYSDVNDACPYPFSSDAGKAFKAAFLKAREAIDAKTIAAKQPKAPRRLQVTLHPVIAERQNQLTTLLATLGQEPGKTPSATIHAASTTSPYDGAELSAPAVRARADTPQGLPSRMGNQLRYRCGRVTDLTGNPIAAGA
jgi:hypothetical protein